MTDAPWRVGLAGGPELRRALRAVHKGLPGQVIPKAGRAAAEEILPFARREAPERTGRLRRSVRVLASQTRAAVAAGSDNPRGRAFYAAMVHSGTVRRRTRSGANRGFVAPNPFLDRALAIVGPRRVVMTYERELSRLLRQHGFDL